MSRRVKLGIMIALFALAVGFAAVTTTLVINGTLSIGPDGEGFDSDVIFTKAKISDGKGSAFISSDGKALNFNVELMELGKDVDLRYDITNKNRQYDAKGSVSCDFVDETNAYNGYITITETPDEFSVNGGTKTSGHVLVRLVRSFAGDETVDYTNVEFKCVIKLEASEREDLAPEIPPVYTDAELNGADPVLTGGLVPISLTNDGKVIYADMYEKWYDYSTKRWANAVLLEDYATAKYDEGDVIKEEDIRSYFVWIPRYRYKLWNVDGNNVINGEIPETVTPETIDIVFETKNVEPSTGTQNGEWLTHPAFTNFDVNGIWVGKYETTVRDGYTGSNKPNNPEVVAIKPLKGQWTNIKFGGMFKSAYNYNRILDSHMMKNTEWGATAYLSHSIYGINNEVRINNLTVGGTGYSGNFAPTCPDASVGSCNGWVNNKDKTNAFNTEIGYLASTTGNITGVYDMAGGREEVMAAYVENGSLGYFNLSAADLETYSEKYLDVYASNSTASSFSNRILGDATGEMGPFYNYEDTDNGKQDVKTTRTHSGWYKDYATFVSPEYPTFRRGGTANNGSLSGQFAFNSTTGSNSSTLAFRVVLAPQ